jgi:hypothetical protein
VAGGSPPDNKTTQVFVQPASINTFTATPASLIRGQPVTLAWATEHANSCTIDQGVGAATPPNKGSIEVTPQATTTYTLAAKGLGPSATQPATVIAQPSGWKQQAPPPASPYDNGPSLLLNYQGKLWLFSLMNDASVHSSVDGNKWNQVSNSVPMENRLYGAGVVFDDGGGEKMWVMGGVDMDESEKNDVWSSTDGVNWTQAQTKNIWSGRYGHTCAVFQDKLWVLGGFDASWDPCTDTVWSSTDGVNWTEEANAPWGARGLVGATVFNPTEPAGINQLWICGGAEGTGPGLADAWYTSDGAKWTQAKTPQWAGRAAPNLIMLNNQLWMLGGFDAPSLSTFLPDMWMMRADLTWTQSASVPTALMQGSVSSNPACAFDYRLWLAGPLKTETAIMQCYTP